MLDLKRYLDEETGSCKQERNAEAKEERQLMMMMMMMIMIIIIITIIIIIYCTIEGAAGDSSLLTSTSLDTLLQNHGLRHRTDTKRSWPGLAAWCLTVACSSDSHVFVVE